MSSLTRGTVAALFFNSVYKRSYVPVCLETHVFASLLQGRGRPIVLSDERIAAVESALREGYLWQQQQPTPLENAVHVQSLTELQEQVKLWTKVEWDANAVDAYYDEWRATGYDEHCKQPQLILTLRALQLTGWKTKQSALPALTMRADEAANVTSNRKPQFLLDLGCGSGLSSKVCAQEGIYVIGVDVSSCMLKLPRATSSAAHSSMQYDRIRCDISHPLPFREQVFRKSVHRFACVARSKQVRPVQIFDRTVSISAAHYMCEPTKLRSAEERCQTLMESTFHTLVRGGRCLMQFYPSDEAAHSSLLLTCAQNSSLLSCLIVDQPHHTQARRWNLHCQRPHFGSEGHARKPKSCALLDDTCASCVLSFKSWAMKHGGLEVYVEKEHEDWLVEEHVRQARRLIRLYSWLNKNQQCKAKMEVEEDCSGDIGRSKRGKRARKGKKKDSLSDRHWHIAQRLVQQFGEDASLHEMMEKKAAVLDCVH